MKDPVFARQFGGVGITVEADETFWGNKGKHRKGARGYAHQEKIFSLVERGGDVRSFHVPHVGANHLKRYIGEFDFRYNNRKIADHERTAIALKGIEGKRLMYHDSRSAKNT